jgi:hypothetical protein
MVRFGMKRVETSLPFSYSGSHKKTPDIPGVYLSFTRQIYLCASNCSATFSQLITLKKASM